MGKEETCTRVVAVKVGSYGETGEAFWRLKEGTTAIQQLYGLLGTAMLKERHLANTKKAQWLKEVSARKLYL